MSKRNFDILLTNLYRQCLDTARLESTADWLNALELGQYSSALNLLEAELNQGTASPHIRLWWVRCHLELNQLPLTALAASLEEIRQLLEHLPELHPLACYTLLRTALALEERGQSRLAVSMLDYSLRFAAVLSEDDENQLRSFYRSVLEDEMTKARQRRENKKYLDALGDKLDALNHSKPTKKRAATVKHSLSSTRDSFTLGPKSILEQARRNSTLKDTENSQQAPLPTLSPGQDSLDLQNQQLSTASPSSLNRQTGLLWLLSLSLAGLCLLLWLNRTKEIDFTAHPTVMQTSLPSVLAMALPSLGDLSSAHTQPSGQGAALDQVGKRIQQLAISKSKEDSSPKKDPENEAQQVTSPGPVAKTARNKNSDEEELASINNIPSVKNDIPGSQLPPPPPVDPKRYEETKVETISSSPRKAELPSEILAGDLKKKGDGRLYGPPQDSDPLSSAPSAGKALDGTPLRSYEVEQFNPPLRYRTTAPTDVLSSPSLLAPSIAHLEIQTPVNVTAKMGPWLELRSAKGNKGYIYSQDALREK